MIITIDGPAGTGKTTVARKVAEKLGFAYFDTGAMYRAITYLVQKEGVQLTNPHDLKRILENFQYDIKKENGNRYFVSGVDVTDVIRSEEVTKKVSEVSARPEVREALVTIQRKFGTIGKAVFEGRDMGTVVFPEAHLKIFLTARPAVRAERRYNEFKGQFLEKSPQDVLKEIMERDTYDSTREISPLKQAEDAHLIDTSDLNIDQVVDMVVSLATKV